MRLCFILFLSIHFYPLANLELLDMWKKEELALGVVDRIEGDKAVILLVDRNEELILAKDKIDLPAREGEWFLISLREKEAILLKPLPQVTSEQRKKSMQLIEHLQEKND